MSLFDSLSKISQQIQSQRSLMNQNEEATISVSVQPFIRALGYDTQNLAEVFPQYVADAKSTGWEKVDFAILRDAKPIIFIEAKGAYISLNENHWKQLYNYFNAKNLRFGILTNGIEYRFYTDLMKQNIMDNEPFLTINMLNLDARLVAELDNFTKSSFDPERIIAAAQRMKILSLLQKDMAHPPDALVKHFARQVHSRELTKADIQRFRHHMMAAWQELVEPEIGPTPTPPPPKVLNIPVFADFKGEHFEATLKLKRDWSLINYNSILYKGELMAHTQAAKLAVHSIDPESSAWAPAWTFWHFTHPKTGEKLPVKRLGRKEPLHFWAFEHHQVFQVK